MGSRCRGLIVSLTMCLLSGVAWSKPTLNVQPNKSRLSVSEFLLLDIQIEVKGDGGEPKLKPPSLNDWERVRVEGSGTQQSISIINGRMSRSFQKNERWILKPKRSGKLAVGSFVLTGEGTQSRSQPFDVLVTDRKGRTAQPLSQSSLAQSNAVTDPATTADKIFLRWNSQTAQPFVGQPFVAFLDLYYDASLRPTSSNGLEQLDLSGFWTEKLPGTEQRERAEVVDGRNYRVQRLVGYRLIPLQAGNRVLPDVSMTIELSSVTQRRGSFFNRQQLVPWGEINAQSQSFPLVVKALPIQGRPKEFLKTSVGETTLSARVAQRSIRADSGVDLTIETKTTGLLENFPLIELNELKDFDVYPGQVRTVDGSAKANRSARSRAPRVQWSRRVQSFLLRPKTSGQLTVPSVRLAYFDPSQARYNVARTKPIRVRVRGKVPDREVDKVETPGRDRIVQRAEFRPLNKSEVETAPLDWSDSIALFYLSLFGFPCAVVLWLLFERGRSSRARNSGDRNAARAFKHAKLALGVIGRETDKSLRGRAKSAKGVALEYLVQRTQESLLGLAYDELAVELQKRGVSPAATGKFVELMETFDYESFSGVVSGSGFEPQLDELLTLLGQLESELST